MQIPVGRVPKFIQARSPKKLRALMLITQARLGYGTEFFDIQFAQGKWTAWYYDNNDVRQDTVEEELNGTADS